MKYLEGLGLALLIIVGVSVLIYMLSMLIPLDYIDNRHRQPCKAAP